jgi:hypothetical protein
MPGIDIAGVMPGIDTGVMPGIVIAGVMSGIVVDSRSSV